MKASKTMGDALKILFADVPLERHVREHGGIVVSLRAHAVCQICNDFADYHADPESVTLEQFQGDAEQYFARFGWTAISRKPNTPTKYRCPSCS